LSPFKFKDVDKLLRHIGELGSRPDMAQGSFGAAFLAHFVLTGKPIASVTARRQRTAQARPAPRANNLTLTPARQTGMRRYDSDYSF
jgi:hypothetical protein